MGAPAVDQAAIDAAVEKAVDARWERSGAQQQIEILAKKNDEVSNFLRSWDDVKGSLADTVDQSVARSQEERFKIALENIGLTPETIEYVRGLEEYVKRLDRHGTAASQRDAVTYDDRWRREAYTSVGRAAIASVFEARGERIPDELAKGGVQRAQLSSDDTKGGVTIPDLRLDDWMILAKDHSVALKIFETVELGNSLTLIVPVLDTDVTIGRLTTEGTTGAGETDATLKSEAASSVEAQVIGAFVAMSRKIPPQSLLAMEQQIGRLLMRQYGNLQDAYILNHASSPFTTMMDAATANHTLDATKVAFTDIQHKDIVALQYAPDPNSIANGVFAWHPSMFGQIVGMQDTQNRPIYHTGWVTPEGMLPNSPVSEGAPGRLLARPSWFSTALPAITDSAPDTAFGLYFDPQFGLIGNSQSPFTETDESQDRKKFMRQIYVFGCFAFKYFEGKAAAVIKTPDS